MTTKTATVPHSGLGSMEERLFLELLDKYVQDARIEFVTDGRRVCVGQNEEPSPDVVVQVARRSRTYTIRLSRSISFRTPISQSCRSP